VIIYFDESYDHKHRYLLLGALFAPKSRELNRELTQIKESHRKKAPSHTFRDLKYSKANDKYVYAACCEAVDAFVSSTAFFRAIAIDTWQPRFSWDYFGNPSTPEPLRKALAYNKFAERLLNFNLQDYDAVFLADHLTRTHGDNFVQYIAAALGPTIGVDWQSGPPRIRHAQEVDTSLEQYQLGQICDILLGVILGALVPPANQNKLQLIEHTRKALAIPSFGADFWQRLPKNVLDVRYPKFQVWHWRPRAS